MPLTIAERTIVPLAMRLPGRASDIALAGTLPFLAIEAAVRESKRVATDALRAPKAGRHTHSDLLRPLSAEPAPGD
jgi:hypothetical protein